jgi:hypothetical protein
MPNSIFELALLVCASKVIDKKILDGSCNVTLKLDPVILVRDVEVVESLAILNVLESISEPVVEVSPNDARTIGDPVNVPFVVFQFASKFIVPIDNGYSVTVDIEEVANVSEFLYFLFDSSASPSISI